MAEKTTEVARRQTSEPGRWEPERWTNPLALFDRMADEMDRVFSDFGVGRNWFGSRRRSGNALAGGSAAFWAPQIEVHQRNNELVVRADLPGMKKDDVRIDVTDHEITISGERRQEQELDRDGVYRSERSYGSFYRTIPLPEGAMTDQAKASFRDGVLEITLPAPPESTRGRRLEIQEPSESKK
jgi:HSP20 family protein